MKLLSFERFLQLSQLLSGIMFPASFNYYDPSKHNRRTEFYHILPPPKVGFPN